MQILLTQTEIRSGVASMAQRIAADYAERPLTVLGILTGSIVLLSDLIREMQAPLRIGLIQASSYRGPTTTPGELVINREFLPEIRGRDVLLLDDIFDTGRTLSALLDAVSELEPRSIRSAVLLWKEGRQRVDCTPDYHAFKIPNLFVVGYGLDYNDEYRNLPYIATLSDAELCP